MLPIVTIIGGQIPKLLALASKILRYKVSIFSVLLTILLGAGSVWTIKNHLENKYKEEFIGWTKRVNDSTIAVLAAKEIEHQNALTDAAKKLKGKLVAGVEIHVKRDTILVPIREVISSTVMLLDSSRVATLQDSIQGHTIKITAVAPPFPANLKIGYELITPEFHPEIGFVKLGQSYTAVVSWAGKTFTVDNVFVIPAERRDPKWNLYGETGLSYDQKDQKFVPPVASINLTKKNGSNTLGIKAGIDVNGHKAIGVVYRRDLWSK